PGTPQSEAARRLITDALTGCGYEVTRQQTAGPGINLLARLPTRPGPTRARILLLSAHYDHLGVVDGEVMNGADDNAAAVGSVVEVACHISKIETSAARPQHTVELLVALWDTEEPPYFLTPDMGSAYFAANPTVPLTRLDAVLVLDLVGQGLWPGFPAHVVLGAETSPELARAVAKTPSPPGLEVLEAGLHLVERVVTNPDRVQPWSDYHAFRERGVPVLFFSNGQGHHYHRPDDDFEKLDLDKLSRQTDWLKTLVGGLLAAPDKPAFAPHERPEVDQRAARRLIELALASGQSFFERASLEADLERLGSDPSPTSLRRAVQRVQCFASGHYPRALCARL
ncbi:MAG TPA: M28 family peptidase, partial [Myxococcota bacterium]|nr:M28 family peptidase [Myxococcota bacterium]